MPAKKYSIANTNYRYGFNGKENDNDIENGAQDYGMRIYDTRLGRFKSVDPLTKKYPELTPYQFASNTPVQAVDIDGKEAFFIHGTASTSAAWTPQLTNLITKTLTNNVHQDATFNWKESKSYFNNEEDRSVAALHLEQHIIQYRKINNIKDEDITLIGHSHGGNVAIQTAEMLYNDYGIKVNIINFNTPAYNATSGNRENPGNNPGIFALRHFWTKQDGVAGGLAGEDKYSNANLVPMFDGKNIELKNPLNKGWLKAHFLENINPAELKEHANEKVPEIPSWERNPEQSIKHSPQNKS
jgi:RHS repeat-associated protein